MLEKRTIVTQIEVARNGVIQIKAEKQIVEDGQVISSQFHRTVIEPGGDPAAQLDAVNAHLVQMKHAPIDNAEWQHVLTAVRAYHTPAAICAWKTNGGTQPPADA